MTDVELMKTADEARERSYSPYSRYSVGAALLCSDGTVYTGANIENAAFSPSVCAERVAIFAAVHDGKRDFSSIAISGGRHGETSQSCAPCGVCRQVMAEFCKKDFRIIMRSESGIVSKTLGEMLPLAFEKDELK